MRSARVLGVVASVVFGVAAVGGQTPAKQAPAKAPAKQAAAPAKPLEIYVVDVEGGKADLYVLPSGETVLIDAGNPGTRDADRIQEVMAAAGVTKIDYLLLTHYHVDHVGGVAEIVKRLPPIGTFIDHGPTVEGGVDLGQQREQVAGFQTTYADMYGKAKHIVVKPGDKLPIAGIDWRIATAGGKVVKTPLVPSAGKPNPACDNKQRPVVERDPENAQSVGSIITFGAFRALDFGDLTQDIEFDLVCPANPIGVVDLYRASNHGTNNANSVPLVHGVRPRIAIAQNNPGKGASVDYFTALRTSADFEDSWQLHWGNAAGAEHNAPGVFIANGVDAAAIAAALTAAPRGGGPGGGGGGRGQGGPPSPPGAPAATAGQPPTAAPPAAAPTAAPPAAAAPAGQGPAGPPAGPAGAGGARGGGGGAAAHTPAYWIKVTVQPNGNFTVTNSRNSFSKTYVHRAR